MKKENNNLNLYQLDNKSIENLIELLNTIKTEQSKIREKLEFIESRNNNAYENSIFMLKIIAQKHIVEKFSDQLTTKIQEGLTVSNLEQKGNKLIDDLKTLYTNNDEENKINYILAQLYLLTDLKIPTRNLIEQTNNIMVTLQKLEAQNSPLKKLVNQYHEHLKYVEEQERLALEEKQKEEEKQQLLKEKRKQKALERKKLNEEKVSIKNYEKDK